MDPMYPLYLGRLGRNLKIPLKNLFIWGSVPTSEFIIKDKTYLLVFSAVYELPFSNCCVRNSNILVIENLKIFSPLQKIHHLCSATEYYLTVFSDKDEIMT